LFDRVSGAATANAQNQGFRGSGLAGREERAAAEKRACRAPRVLPKDMHINEPPSMITLSFGASSRSPHIDGNIEPARIEETVPTHGRSRAYGRSDVEISFR
jgi:hypothetical protein